MKFPTQIWVLMLIWRVGRLCRVIWKVWIYRLMQWCEAEHDKAQDPALGANNPMLWTWEGVAGGGWVTISRGIRIFVDMALRHTIWWWSWTIVWLQEFKGLSNLNNSLILCGKISCRSRKITTKKDQIKYRILQNFLQYSFRHIFCTHFILYVYQVRCTTNIDILHCMQELYQGHKRAAFWPKNKGNISLSY